MGCMSWRRLMVYQRMIGRLEAEEQLQWLPILKTEGKGLQPLIRDLEASARVGESTGTAPRRRRRKEGQAAEPATFVLDYQMNTQGVHDPHKEPGIVTGSKALKAQIKAQWVEEAKQLRAERMAQKSGSST